MLGRIMSVVQPAMGSVHYEVLKVCDKLSLVAQLCEEAGRFLCYASFPLDAENFDKVGRVKELKSLYSNCSVKEGDVNCLNEVNAAFAGSDVNIPVTFPAKSEFTVSVWKQLCRIPYGKTATYSEVAAAIGNPKAVRAVATACSQNPIAVIVPCHRVIGSDGSLRGYAFGLENKRKLLEREGVVLKK